VLLKKQKLNIIMEYIGIRIGSTKIVGKVKKLNLQPDRIKTTVSIINLLSNRNPT
jgi:hypothetical protein